MIRSTRIGLWPDDPDARMTLAGDGPMKHCSVYWHDGFSSAISLPIPIRSKPHRRMKSSFSHRTPMVLLSKNDRLAWVAAFLARSKP